MVGFLESLKVETNKNRPPVWLFYAQTGAGKSSLAAQFPSNAYICGSAELGIKDLIAAGKVHESSHVYVVNTFEDIENATKALLADPSGHRTVTFDTLTDVLRMLKAEVLAKSFNGDVKNYNNYSNGDKACLPRWEAWLADVAKLQDAGLHVVLLAQARIRRFNDPNREAYDQWVPSLDEGKLDFLQPVLQMCTEVGFIDYVVYQAEDRKKRATGGKRRMLLFERTASYEAKSRYGLDEVSLGASPEEGFNNLREAFATAKGQTTNG